MPISPGSAAQSRRSDLGSHAAFVPQPRRVLVTGASGFIGTYLCAALEGRWPNVELFALAKTAASTRGVVAADLMDRAAMETAVLNARPDVIVHLAAQSSVALGAQEASETWAVNVAGSLNLAIAIARAAPEATLLFASSSEVYGASLLAGPADEMATLLPMNAYARSKAIAERIFAEVLPASTQLVIARPFNHTGPGQTEDFVLPSLVAQVVRIERGLQPPYLQVGNLDVVRDFLDVRDVVEAYLRLIESASRLPHRFTCNIASERARPLSTHVEVLRRLARRDFDIAVEPTRLRRIDVPVAAGDARLLRAITGWSPRHNMTSTLRSMLDAARKTSGP